MTVDIEKLIPIKIDRKPLPISELEEARIDKYWENLEKYKEKIIEHNLNKGQIIDSNLKFNLVKLQTRFDADYEAVFMQHSVGYNWDHYSQFGDIFSLRKGNRPIATLLVSAGKIIHAREQENSHLSKENIEAVLHFCNKKGWEFPQEDKNFDFFVNGSENTKIKYFVRNGDDKIFHQIILKGKPNEEQIEDFLEVFENGIEPEKYGMPVLGNGKHEIQSIKIVDDPHTSEIDLNLFLQNKNNPKI